VREVPQTRANNGKGAPVKPHLSAIIGGFLWYVGGVLSANHMFAIAPVFCLFGGLVLGVLAGRVRP
jgi:hypothetical protein